MTNDDLIAAYVRDVDALLATSDDDRNRVLAEIDGHLRDSAAERADQGLPMTEAISQAIREFGPPQAVAAEFATNGAPAATITGARRWLPALLPAASSLLFVAALLWSLTWLPAGRTAGQRYAQEVYLRSAAVSLTFLAGALWAIRNADRDQRWRRVAWFCAALAALFLVT